MDDNQSAATNTGAEQGNSVISPECLEVLLMVFRDVLSTYERSAEMLREDYDLPDITFQFLMHVCLAVPKPDDLVLGIVRDNLMMVSESDQTRRMVERDLGYLDRSVSESPKSTKESGLKHNLSIQELVARKRAEAKTATERNSALGKFITDNPEAHKMVSGLTHSELVQWVMLTVMRSMENSRRGNRVIEAMVEKMDEKTKMRLKQYQAQYAALQLGKTQSISPAIKPDGPRQSL